MKTGSQTFIIPYRHMLSKHTVKSSFFVFYNAIQDNPRQNWEEIRLLGIVGNWHAKVNQLKTQQQTHNKLKFHKGLSGLLLHHCLACFSVIFSLFLTWIRLLASRAMLEKWGTLLRSSDSLLKQTSMPSSSFLMMLTHSSLLGGEVVEAELSCCRASFRATSLHSKHCW